MTARDRLVLLVLVGACALAGFWFAILGPKRDEASKLSAQITEQRARLASARQLEASAQAAKARYDEDYATVARLGKAVPVQDDVPSLVYQLDATAKAHGVDFHDFQAGAAQAPAPSTQTPAAQVAQVGAAEKGTDNSASTAAPAAPATVGPAALPVIPFNFTFNGGYFGMQRFIRALDRLTFLRADTLQVAGRLLTINGLSLTVDPNRHSQVQAVIDADAFKLPADEGLTAGATAQGPQSSSTQTTSTVPTATATGVTP
jgi:Tfp pilus assembly protein PilN